MYFPSSLINTGMANFFWLFQFQFKFFTLNTENSDKRPKVGRSTVTRTWQILGCKKHFFARKIFSTKRVQGLPIRDCTRDCNNCGHTRPQMSAIYVTEKILFERLYLVSGMGTFGPWVSCPYAPTTPTVHPTTICRFPCNFFPRMAPHFFGHHDSPSNLAESQYPFHEPPSSDLLTIGGGTEDRRFSSQ